MLCFKDVTASIIREYHNNTEDDNKTTIIISAVKLIINDIALVNINSSLYPSINAMTDHNGQLKLIPESLKTILKTSSKTRQTCCFLTSKHHQNVKAEVWSVTFTNAFCALTGT